MKRPIVMLCVLLTLLIGLNALAADLERPSVWGEADAQVFAGNQQFAKAAGDTFLLMGPTGSGAPYIGDFEVQAKTLDPLASNGWTSEDVTQPTESHWQISSYQQRGGDLAAWCGQDYPRCTPTDSLGGYGNSWHDLIELRHAVTNPFVSTTVNVQASLQVWTEPGYDFVYLSRKVNGIPGFEDAESWDGPLMASGGGGVQAVNNGFTYLPGEYLNSNQIAVYFRFLSDGGWSDEDCAHPSSNTAGACQVDDTTVTVTNDGVPTVYTDDFEGGFGNWEVVFPDGVGDFTKIWEGLEDDDICRTNSTRQVAWIDDGLVVSGTGGTECITHCYGPSGYIVNNTGGLAGPAFFIHDYAVGPVMDWPNPTHDGMFMAFTVYMHETEQVTSGGMYYRFRMRSADLDAGQAIATQPWVSGGNWFGGPAYNRQGRTWTNSLVPGRDQVQIEVGVWELGWAFGAGIGADGTPAPYFDNIQVITYPITGPAFALVGASEGTLAQDTFPEIGDVDAMDLSRNSCRFDMGWNISPASDLRNDPGDSVVINCVPARTGAALTGPPAMHWAMQANPLFDGVRGATPPNPLVGTTSTTAGQFFFDFPDTGFLFPGDRLQYYFEATDAIGGLNAQTNTLPANLAGFGDFSDPLAYNTAFEIHCLPSVSAVDGLGGHTQPTVLFWNDFFNRGGENEWFGALSALGLEMGVDYDAYWTNRPDNGAGNGLGGRAQLPVIEDYDDLLYTAGDLGTSTISNGDFGADASDDIGLIDAWLSLAGKDFFMTGDDVVFDLQNNQGTTGQTFVQNKIGVTWSTQAIIDFIGGQATPVVKAPAYNVVTQPVFAQVNQWIAYGGCLGINDFDGVAPVGGAIRLAEFTDPNGNIGAYSYSAATLKITGTSRVVSLPYDLMYVYDDPAAKIAAPKAARTLMLSDVLNYFGVVNDPGNTVPVPGAGAVFATANYPNPFNPVTKIQFRIKTPGHMTMKVFNLRGELVKTLIDGHVSTDGEMIWDGTNNQGGTVASGVYFHETRMNGETQIGKMSMVK